MEKKILKVFTPTEIATFKKMWAEIPPQPITILEQADVEFVGNVFEREIDYGNDIEYVAEVADGKGNKLSEILENFIGEKVKIKIEVLPNKF